MSRTPLRQALQRLQQEGLVEAIPKVGRLVPALRLPEKLKQGARRPRELNRFTRSGHTADSSLCTRCCVWLWFMASVQVWRRISSCNRAFTARCFDIPSSKWLGRRCRAEMCSFAAGEFCDHSRCRDCRLPLLRRSRQERSLPSVR